MNAFDGSDVRLLREVIAGAAEVFIEPPRRRAAITYLRQRGVDASSLSTQWVLGYAPPGWTRLVDALCGQFSDQALLAAGLAKRCSRGTLIDTFRHRAVFGIRDAEGTIAGFIGRDLSGHPNAPKYLNTRQHALFDKGALLYGLHEGVHTDGARLPVLVEGPLDVLAIAARQQRDRHAAMLPIAASGTAFTIVQALRVAEVAFANRSRVVVAMDGDGPGRAAALAAGEHLRYAGLDVRIAALPNGTDPAEYLAHPGNSVDAFRADRGLPLITARIEDAIASQGTRMQWVEGRVAALRAISRYLATYPPNVAARQVAVVAGALGFDSFTVATDLADAYQRTTAIGPANAQSIAV